MKEITIAIVDDDRLIVNLLKGYLENQKNINVLFTCESGEELLEILPEKKEIPKVLILDLKMKKLSGIDVTTHLKLNYPSISVIIMSSHYKRSFMGFMLKTGVSAFIPKGVMPQQLVEIIKEVHRKGVYFMDDQLDVIREQLSSKTPKPAISNKNNLSERELEILRLICFQKKAKEIGEQLFITPRTVEGHKNNLFIKTGAKNIAGLVIYAIQNKLIDTSDIPLI